MDILERLSMEKCSGNREYTARGSVVEVSLSEIKFFSIADESEGSDIEIAESLLASFFDIATDSHHFTDRLHL